MKYRIKQVNAGTFYVQRKWMGVWWTHRHMTNFGIEKKEFLGIASAEMFIEEKMEQQKYPIYYEYR